MKKNMLNVLILALCALSQNLLANDGRVVFNFNFLYMTEQNVDEQPLVSGTTETDRKLVTNTARTYYNLGLCRFFSRICVGANYLNNTVDVKRDLTLGGVTVSTQAKGVWNGIGLSLGIIEGGFFANLSYYFLNSFIVTGTDAVGTETEEKYDGGTAYNLNIGYGFKVGSSAMLGPQFSYMHFDYKKVTIDGEKDDIGGGGMADTNLIPQVAFMYMF